MKKTPIWNRLLSLLLALVMVIGMAPMVPLEAEAASNMENGFEGQDADVFSALGFDTSEKPEGYDAETTENPYGRDTILGNQVWEAFVASSKGTSIYGKNSSTVSGASITGMPSSGAEIGMEMYAVAAADFDGDGLQGEVVYVGFDDIKYNTYSEGANLQLQIYDAKDGSISDLKTIGSDINPAQVIKSGGTKYSRYDYAWQNLLQVSAGDYDGDGRYEIAVYVPEDGNCRVDIYKYQETSQSGEDDWMKLSNWDRVWTYVVTNTDNEIFNMVSLVSADINLDGVDDLGISYGRLAPYGTSFSSMDVDKSKAVILWGAKSNMLQTNSALNLNEGELGELTRVSLTVGDLDGDGAKELIATGQPVSDVVNYFSSDYTERNTTRSITTYIYDSAMGLVVNSSGLYKPLDGQMITTENEETGTTTGWQSNNGFDENYLSKPFMRTNAAAFHPEGYEYPFLYLDSCLYECMQGQFALKMSLDDLKYDGQNTLETPWEVTNYEVRGVMSYVEYGVVSADLNGDGYDTLMTSMHAYSENYDPSPSILKNEHQHCASYRTLYSTGGALAVTASGVTNWQAATATLTPAAVAMVDADMDTVILEYTGVHYLTYSDPEVLAIIAAAPYFEDVDVICDYDYAWQNATSYSRTEGSGHTDHVAVDFEVGVFASMETEVGGGKIGIETSANFTLEWQEETTKTTEYTLTFETSQDEDAVAFYCIPTENYVYRIRTPDGKGGYTESLDTITNTFAPCYQVLTLEYYESIQGNYDELPQIAGKAITSTPGDPRSYPSSTSGYDVVAEWHDDPAGVSFGNGAISQEITITKEQAESYNMGAAWDFQFGGGIGSQSDLIQYEMDILGGIQWSLNPTGGWTDVNFEGTTISGTVTNMPLEFQDYGYYYTWKLFSYNYKFDNGTSIPVISYVVGDISEPPQLPEDFQQDYDRTTSDKNVLTWSYDGAFSHFNIFKYYDFPVGGGLQLIATVPSDTANYTLKYDESGKPYKEYFFEDPNLTPYTEYEYAIQVQRPDKEVPPLSAPSGLLVARTKAASGYPAMSIVESDGENDRLLKVYPDKSAYLTVQVTGPNGEAASSYYTTVQYQWQKKENGAWVDQINEIDMTKTLISAGVDTAGEYRCRVNVLTKADATAITAYTDPVTLTHAKRTSYFGELYAKDVSGGVELYAEVCNAHADSASIPGGFVTFNLTNNSTGQHFQYFVELNAAGVATEIREALLPEGMYTVSAYYSGSFIFKASSAEALYLSQRSNGYDIDVPAELTYGDGAAVVYRQVSKSYGFTETKEAQPDSYSLLAADRLSINRISGAKAIGVGDYATAGNKYYIDLDAVRYYFTASKSGTVAVEDQYVVYSTVSGYMSFLNDGGKYELAKNLPAGNYVIKMVTDNKVTYAPVTVNKRALTLQLPTQQIGEGIDHAPYVTLGSMQILSGSWADCDMTDGKLSSSLSETVVNLKYYNTAGTAHTGTEVVDQCGYYIIRDWGNNASKYPNYSIKLAEGVITVIGATRDVTIGARPFEGESVGTVYAVSPDYAQTRVDISDSNALVLSHATGTRMVFSAVADEGYEIYEWYINGVAQGSKASSFAYVLLAEDTTVEVQFAIKQNNLIFGVTGDKDGGTLTCSDPDLTSDSVVLANATFTFTAKANEGYHFKEWRYTEIGKGTAYDDDDNGTMESTFDLLMPATGCSVYAVFERDSYTFTYEDRINGVGLTAWYMGSNSGDSTAGLEKIVINSGDQVKGDTAITVEAAPGYDLDEDYAFTSRGTQGYADYDAGTYTLKLTEPTTVTAVAQRQNYHVTLEVDVEQNVVFPVGTRLVYTIDDKEDTHEYTVGEPGVTLQDVPGGSDIAVYVDYPGYYNLIGWYSENTQLTATAEVNKAAVEVKYGAAVEAGTAYWYSVTINNATVARYFTAPVDGIVRWDGEQVTVYIQNPNCQINDLDKAETLYVRLEEKPVYTVTIDPINGYGTYKFTTPEGSVTSTGADNVTTVKVHEGEELTVLVTPAQKWTVSYWEAKAASMSESVKVRATSLKYTIPDIRDNYTFKPIFSSTTYNTIAWPTISEDQNMITLSPVSGYLSSVSSGSEFKFTLSGAGVGLIDQVFANGVPFVSASSGNAGQCTVSGGVYTISNIQENQVITVTLKNIGITINGEDLSNLRGTGWTYDHNNQTVNITRPGLTVSGAVALSNVGRLKIHLNEEAVSLTLENLNLVSKADKVIEATGETVSLVLSGKNSIANHSTSSVYMIHSPKELIVRGNGALELKTNYAASGIRAYALTFTGNCNVDITTNGGYGVLADYLFVGVERGTTNPTLRAKTTTGYPIYTGMTTTYTGELLAHSQSNNAVVAEWGMSTIGGIVEVRSETQTAIGANTTWLAAYSNGYLKRATTQTGGEPESYTILKGDYFNDTFDVVCDQAYSYVRTSPVSSEDTSGNVILTVTYNGREYTAAIDGQPHKYYYIDLADPDHPLLKTAILGPSYKGGSEVENADWLIVAYNELASVITKLGTAKVTFAYYENYGGEPFKGYKAYVSNYGCESLEYKLSGGSSRVIENMISIEKGVEKLTLDNLTSGSLHVGDLDLHLRGDNYLIALLAVPLSTDDTLNLYSDGNGTLTANASTLQESDLDPHSALTSATTINLYDVKSLTLFSGSSAIGAGSEADINFFSGGYELDYGQGWHIDAGEDGVTATTCTSSASTDANYMKIYADTTDGSVSPNAVTMDKDKAEELVETFNLTYLAEDGKIVPIMTDTADGVTYTTVLFIDSDGRETKLKLAQGDTVPDGYNGCYTDNRSGAALTVDLNTVDLSAVTVGKYTLRFQQRTETGVVYATDASVKITNSSVGSGDLSMVPGTVTLSPGQSATFTAAYTGTTPSSFTFSDGLTEGDQVSASNQYTFTVPADAAVGTIYTINAYSYVGNTQLGTASATVTVCDAANGIAVSTEDLTPDEDGTYTIHSIIPSGLTGTYDFDGAVTMYSGEAANDANLKWSLWGNSLRATKVDPDTGVLTVSTRETGTDGIMKIIATYTNDDGTTFCVETVLNICVDAYVGRQVVGTVNGEAVTDIHGTLTSNADAQDYIPGGETAVVTAHPDENHQVATWYFNGEAVTEETTVCTVNAEENTLSFLAEELTHYVVGVEFTHYHDSLEHDGDNHWMECSCGDMFEVETHYDEDKNHNCDKCDFVMSECIDEDKNHYCDYCGEKLSECADIDPADHKCDYCLEQLSDHVDEDTDHYCEYCSERFSECDDLNGNHFCDYCTEKISYCIDEQPADHLCDVCGRELSTCADEDIDHLCDICGERLTECVDETADHICDVCGQVYDECVDNNNDHNCDLCGKEDITECTDTDPADHVCDICGETLTECVDEDGDHICDICGQAYGSCVDEDNDHICDLCGEIASECADVDQDHNCDVCGDELSQCADNDNNHLCDVCSKELSQCADNDSDHYCDTCGKHLTACVDQDLDNFCDICGKELNVHDCIDENSDHLCDICGKTVSECADADNDHLCDVCGKVLTVCVNEDGDHNCDICDIALSQCADENSDHNCDVCGEPVSTCADNNNDHCCDVCGVPVSTCADNNSDHNCDVCGMPVSTCADDNSDHLCDICGTVLTVCEDNDSDHNCDICGTEVNKHKDDDNNHYCDICGDELSTCVDNNNDHNCDICGTPVSECTDEDDHLCDICGNKVSECADEADENGFVDHKCDVCDAVLTQCVDEDADHICDLCGAEMHDCADEDPQDHVCDHCGYTLTECADEDGDHVCDWCGETSSLCADDDNDHLCDICGETVSECADEDDHLCDICGETLSECVDADHNDVCDICGAVTNIHVDENSDHRCDVCALPLSECDDNDKDHLCDLCGVVWSVCVDKNTDHACDICGVPMGNHTPADGSHICDYCGEPASECADTDSNHFCDVCGDELSKCVDETDENGLVDHLCDICGTRLSECTDEDRNHICDLCGVIMSICADGDNDHLCDICGATLSICTDEQGDHICDICGAELACTDLNNDHLCDYCADKISECADDDNDHLCDICGLTLSKCVDEDNNYICDICGEKISSAIRVSGSNRFITAFKVANETKLAMGVEKFDTVVIASGTNFADALSGTYLASVKNAPILLSYNDAINAEVHAYIEENLVKGGTVYILGGNAAVPETLDVMMEGFNVIRLAGKTRYETNLMILEEAGVEGKDVLICTGTGFADSLSAAALKRPILLVGSSLTEAQEEFLAGTTGTKYIIGGNAAVNAEIEAAVEAYGTVERISGSTRYETSVNVAKTFFNEPAAAVLTYAQNFPDGLSGGALAFSLDVPLILADSNKYEVAAEYAEEQNIRNGYVLGGSGLVGDEAVRSIFGMSSEDVIQTR